MNNDSIVYAKAKLENNKREYIKKIFETVLLGEEKVNIVFMANHSLDNVYNTIVEVAKNYNINQLAISGIDLKNFGYYKKIDLEEYKIPLIFFGCHENRYHNIWKWFTEDKIKENIPDFSSLDHRYKTKIVFSQDDKIIIDENRRQKYNELIDFYYSEHQKKNEELWKIIGENIDFLFTIIPNDNWSERLHSTEYELWNMLNEIVPSIYSAVYQKEIQRIKHYNEILKKMAIRNLYFYTDKGTDFKIGLSSHSRWISNPLSRKIGLIKKINYYTNFPSYEIYTAPDALSAEGKIVITKPNNIVNVNEATFEFEKGKVIRCITDNDIWTKRVLNEKNMLNRIGEIALVPKDVTLNRNDLLESFESILFDENTACHFALGNAYKESTNLGSRATDEDMKKNNFNVSDHHYDFVFGDDSITVEAETKKKKKVLLMENGIWKI